MVRCYTSISDGVIIIIIDFNWTAPLFVPQKVGSEDLVNLKTCLVLNKHIWLNKDKKVQYNIWLLNLWLSLECDRWYKMTFCSHRRPFSAFVPPGKMFWSLYRTVTSSQIIIFPPLVALRQTGKLKLKLAPLNFIFYIVFFGSQDFRLFC